MSDEFNDEEYETDIEFIDLATLNNSESKSEPNRLTISSHYKVLLELAKQSNFTIAINFFYENWSFIGFVLDYDEKEQTITTLDFPYTKGIEKDAEMQRGFSIGIHDATKATMLEATSAFEEQFAVMINLMKQNTNSVLYKYYQIKDAIEKENKDK